MYIAVIRSGPVERLCVTRRLCKRGECNKRRDYHVMSELICKGGVLKKWNHLHMVETKIRFPLWWGRRGVHAVPLLTKHLERYGWSELRPVMILTSCWHSNYLTIFDLLMIPFWFCIAATWTRTSSCGERQGRCGRLFQKSHICKSSIWFDSSIGRRLLDPMILVLGTFSTNGRDIFGFSSRDVQTTSIAGCTWGYYTIISEIANKWFAFALTWKLGCVNREVPGRPSVA